MGNRYGLSPGKIFWFTDVQTQAWTNYLLHLPQPQSKHTLIFKAATQQTKKHNFCAFMAVPTQAWTNSLLHVPQPQSKDTFIFTAATHKQRMCLHASRSRISQTVFCTVHVQCTHSARYSARHSARPQNAVNTMGLAFCWQFTKNYKNILFFVFSDYFWENTWYLQRFVAVHCDVHCACTVRALCKTRCLCPLIFSSAERCNSASGGVQAHSILVHHARHTALISNFGPHAEQMLQCCFFVCG